VSSSTARGRQAERIVAAFLERNNCVVLAQNWRTRWCEIDIVAIKDDTIYFVEVKYRGSNSWGGGLDYITPKKLQQMRFAAQFWCATNASIGNYSLAAAELTGDPPRMTAWLKDIV
jgi:ribonuclease HII